MATTAAPLPKHRARRHTWRLRTVWRWLSGANGAAKERIIRAAEREYTAARIADLILAEQQLLGPSPDPLQAARDDQARHDAAKALQAGKWCG